MLSNGLKQEDTVERKKWRQIIHCGKLAENQEIMRVKEEVSQGERNNATVEHTTILKV